MSSSHSLPPTGPQPSFNTPISISQPPPSPGRPSFTSSRPPASTQPPALQQHPQHPHGSTHAGGIQPSASFFRPSRPSHVLSSRSISPTPSSSLPSVHDATVEGSDAGHHHLDNVKLNNLNKKPSLSSLIDHSEIKPNSHNEIGGMPKRSGVGKRVEVPSSTGVEIIPPAIITTSPTRQSLQQQRGNAGASANSPPSSPIAGKRVRTSLDAIFNLRRGLSTSRSIASSAIRSQQIPRKSFNTTGTFTEDEDEERSVGYPPQKYMPPSPSPSPPYSNVYSQSTAYFTSTRPPAHPPMSAVPIIDPKSKSGKPMRNHRLHPSRNRFYLDGRILTGGDSPMAFIGSFAVLVIISGIWFGTTCVWYWRDSGSGGGKAVVIIGLYACLIVVSTMLFTAFTDPGILPRNLDPDPPYPSTATTDGTVRVPLPRDLKVRSDIVRVKYCPTCKTYRPPRSSHCKMCDNCVDGCDHHCQWVNNCIGRRNYGTFFALLFFAVLTIILVLCTSAIHLAVEAHRRGSFHRAISSSLGIGSALAFCLSICVIWPVSALLAYHVRLLLLNITTIEQIRNQAHKTLVPGHAPLNPFSHGGWRRNLIAVLGRPRGYSWLDPRGIATEDRRDINPGLQPMSGGSRTGR